MENHLLPETRSPEKKIVIFIIAVVILAVCGYAGFRQVMKWHENKMRTADLAHQEHMAETTAGLQQEIHELEDKMAMLTPPAVPEERIEEVFGTIPSESPAGTEPPCDLLKEEIDSFFDYLRQYDEAPDAGIGKDPRAVFNGMLLALAANPPLVVDETRDIISLKHNLAHFFRVLKKDRIEMVKNILTAEADVLEHAMANFYRYYVTSDCCDNAEESCLSIQTLYEYAGFFTSTIAGKSYLFRRPSAIRSLIQYYAVLILDRAETEGINRYGIDIRPHIDLVMDTIRGQRNLIFQDRYLKKLSGLQEKYAG
jgi:hypothetical protein